MPRAPDQPQSILSAAASIPISRFFHRSGENPVCPWPWSEQLWEGEGGWGRGWRRGGGAGIEAGLGRGWRRENHRCKARSLPRAGPETGSAGSAGPWRFFRPCLFPPLWLTFCYSPPRSWRYPSPSPAGNLLIVILTTLITVLFGGSSSLPIPGYMCLCKSFPKPGAPLVFLSRFLHGK